MQRRIIAAAAGIVASALWLGACGTDASERAATGALAGGGIGALVGGPIGALVGLGVGGLGGAALPESVDQVALRAIGPTSEVSLGRPVPQVMPTAPPLASPSPEPVAVPAVVVKQIQAALNRKGLYSGAVDGRIGDQTQSALAEYQARAGLPRTGLLDQRTLDRLVNEPEFTNFAISVPLNAPR